MPVMGICHVCLLYVSPPILWEKEPYSIGEQISHLQPSDSNGGCQTQYLEPTPTHPNWWKHDLEFGHCY